MKMQLHTVFIESFIASDPNPYCDPDPQTYYQTNFAGIHFSRTDLAQLKHWVRVAARNVYGNGTQVIFLERKL